MRTANPALSAKSFGGFVGSSVGSSARLGGEAARMTIQGTVNRTGLLLAIVVACAVVPWRLAFRSGDPGAAMPWMVIGFIGGLITALITIFKKSAAPVT